MARQRIEPRQLPGEIGVIDILAVGHVDRGERQLANAAADEAGALVVLTGKPPGYHLDGPAAGDSHTVPGFLAVDGHAVTQLIEDFSGKLVVGKLEFLHPDNIGLARFEPEPGEIEPCPKPVYVPGGNPHTMTRILKRRRNHQP